MTSHGRWYLLGWDLDRVPRVVPGGDVDAFVSARCKGSDTTGWPCRGTVLLHARARHVLPFAGDGTVTAVDEKR